jgi:hypothetical protein
MQVIGAAQRSGAFDLRAEFSCSCPLDRSVDRALFIRRIDYAEERGRCCRHPMDSHV